MAKLEPDLEDFLRTHDGCPDATGTFAIESDDGQEPEQARTKGLLRSVLRFLIEGFACGGALHSAHPYPFKAPAERRPR